MSRTLPVDSQTSQVGRGHVFAECSFSALIARGVFIATVLGLAACGGGGRAGNADSAAGERQMVGGTVSGLSASGLVLQNNAGDDLVIAANGGFNFSTKIASGSSYSVSVRTQPLWQFCTVSGGSGTVASAVGHVAVACAAAVAEVSTLAGSGAPGFVEGNGAAATFSNPFGIVVDSHGGLTVSDAGFFGNRVRKVSANGDVTNFAGNGTLATVDGNGTAASFNNLYGITLAPSGDIYAAEYAGHRIRKITPAADVSTFVGTGVAGLADGNAASATLNGPAGMASDASGNIYLTQPFYGLIRKITPAGDVSTLAGSGGLGFADGTGAAASFSQPFGMAVDAAGNVFVADTNNNRIRKVTPGGVVTTGAGTGSRGATDGEASTASFYWPRGVAFDAAGNLYVADAGNHLLRRITPDGMVSTLAGQAGVSGSQNGIGAAATFNDPSGLAVGADGSIYVADYSNNLIRKVIPVGAR